MDNKDKLISVCLELTDVCCVGCPYCLLENRKPAGSKETTFKILEMLFQYGVKRYSLGGGEILYIPYVYEVGEFIKKHHGVSLLRTSASVPIDCYKAKKSFDMIDISIDSTDFEILKVCKPNIDVLVPLENIKRLVDFNIPLRCNILITKYNYNDLLRTITKLHEIGVKEIRLQKLVARGKARNIFRRIVVPENMFADLVNQCCLLGNELNMKISVLETVASQTLCIIKPDGDTYAGNPNGLINLGSIFEPATLVKAGNMLSENQRKYYEEYY